MATQWSSRWEQGNDDLKSKHDAYVSASQSYDPSDKDDNQKMAQAGQELVEAMQGVDSSAFSDKSDFEMYRIELEQAVERFQSNFQNKV